MLALSATPNREDGLENIFFNSIGKIGYQAVGLNKIDVDVNVINYSSKTYKEIRRWNKSLDLHKMLECQLPDPEFQDVGVPEQCLS